MPLWSIMKNILWNPANLGRLFGRPMFLIRLYCVLSISGFVLFKEFQRRKVDSKNPGADVEIGWSLYFYRIYPVTLLVTEFRFGDILNVYVYIISSYFCLFLSRYSFELFSPFYYGLCKALWLISVQVLILNAIFFVFTIFMDWGMGRGPEEREDNDELEN